MILARPSLGRPYLGVVGCAPFHHPCRQHVIKTEEVSSVRSRCPVCLPNHRVFVCLEFYYFNGWDQRDLHITRYDIISCVIKIITQGQRNIHISRLTPPQTYPIYCEVWWYKSSERPQYLPQRCHPYESLPTRNWNQRNIHHHSQTVGANQIVANFFNRTYFFTNLIYISHLLSSQSHITALNLCL